MTFMARQHRNVHERYRGDDTRHIVKNMNEYNLDGCWSVVNY